MPNTFAYIALFLWPLVVLILFRRLPLPAAVIWSVLGGYLFLPEEAAINLPLLPSYDKVLVPGLAALIIGWITLKQQGYRPAARAAAAPQTAAQTGAPSRRRSAAPARTKAPRRVQNGQSPAQDESAGTRSEDSAPARQRGRWIANLLILVLLASVVGTWATNSERINAGVRSLPPMSIYDMFSVSLGVLVMLIPFYLGRRYLGTPQAHRILLRALVTAALVYSLFILVEVRLSPQINKWVYGFYSHSFAQHIRGDGYRPMVFVGHGLRLGIFIAMSVLAALALYRLRADNKPFKWLMISGWLFVILFLSKTLGAFMIAVVLIPAAMLLNLRLRLLVGVMIAGLVLTYPLLRSSGVLSMERMMTMTQSLEHGRMKSFEYRLRNEDILLDKAIQKPLFGWGGWGRPRVYDMETGRDLSVTDGIWVIEIGKRGWIGYLAVFGLLTLPVLALFLRQGRLGLDGATGGLVLVHSANLVDMLPNSSLTPVTWLIAGALLARYEMGPAAESAAPEEATLQRRAMHQRNALPAARQAPVPAGGKRRA
ncbi:MAG: hypothetical protein ACRBBV_04850 [Paracoccaceae bacterium]